jgi:hypothetical protein
MYTTVKESLWQQFGASIAMLENAVIACPAAHWDTDTKFWYNAYHSLFFLDFYLSLDATNFSPPAPFSLSEFEDRMPERVYSKEEVLSYLQFCRHKCFQLIDGLTAQSMTDRWRNESGSMDYSMVEIILYNMRHVQHHAAQLNLLLRQAINDAPHWVSRVNKLS